MYTFAQPLSRALSIAAGSTAVVCQDHRRTYAELGSRCRRLAGAMRTHRSLVSSALHFMATWPFDQQTRWLVASPMFHTGGILATLATVWAGGTHVIMPRFDPDLAVDLIEREAVTHTLLVPTMLAAAARAQLTRPRDVSSLRYLSHGASPISAETLRRTRQAFPGAELLHVYGTTETTPITTLLPHEELILGTPLVHSCGQPAVGVEMRVVNDALDDLPPHAVGQIAVRGPSVMAGYWRNPEATAEVMRGGWYLTGDLGYRDEACYIYLVDRAKDMIVSGGENIYSTEVEDALGSHPAVEEVAVFGVPDPRWGETVYAVVFSRTPVTADDLVAQCRGRIAGFKVPRSIELRTEPLPKSAAGKILKRELRDPHWAGQQAQVSGG